MDIVKVLRRGAKNSRVLLKNGQEKMVPTSRLDSEHVEGPTLTLVRGSSTVPAPAPKAHEPTIQERFDQLAKLTDMVVSGASPSLIICGDAGIGKTFLVRERLKGAGLTEQVVSADANEGQSKKDKKRINRVFLDRQKKHTFLLVKGYSSPMGLFQVLHDNREAVIVFDDCDSIFKAPVSVNILKSALDSYDTRIVTWLSNAAEKMGLEPRFEFKGKIIFISNMQQDEFDLAVASRSFLVNIHLTRQEIWERMLTLIDNIEPLVDIGLRTDALNHIGMHVDSFKEFNMRTLIKAIRIRKSGNPNWKEMILTFA